MGALEKLKETAQHIREAVYGIEVRDSIADGFDTVVDAQNEYEAETTTKLETKLNEDFNQFSTELTIDMGVYVDNRVEERIVEVMDDLSDDNLRSEIQQARNSATYAVNYGSVDARLEADEVKLKDVVSEVSAARSSAANGKTYSNLDARLEEDEVKIKQLEQKREIIFEGLLTNTSNLSVLNIPIISGKDWNDYHTFDFVIEMQAGGSSGEWIHVPGLRVTKYAILNGAFNTSVNAANFHFSVSMFTNPIQMLTGELRFTKANNRITGLGIVMYLNPVRIRQVIGYK